MLVCLVVSIAVAECVVSIGDTYRAMSDDVECAAKETDNGAESLSRSGRTVAESSLAGGRPSCACGRTRNTRLAGESRHSRIALGAFRRSLAPTAGGTQLENSTSMPEILIVTVLVHRRDETLHRSRV